MADRAANAAPDARERRKGIGLGINGVDFETALQFFEDEGLLHADQRQFDIRKRLDVLADFRVDACPMFSFDFRLPTHSELKGPFRATLPRSRVPDNVGSDEPAQSFVIEGANGPLPTLWVCDRVYSIDIDPDVPKRLASKFPNVEFLTGRSDDLLPPLIDRLQLKARS